MFYLFQLGTDMMFFTCAYFIEILIYITLRSLGVPPIVCEKTFLYTTPIILSIIFLFKIFNKKRKEKTCIENNIFHPTTTIRQRIAEKTFLTNTCVYIVFVILFIFLFKNNSISFIVTNIFSICSIAFSFIISLYLEPLPDRDDTLRFDDFNLYYYMRVKKGIKNNKYMNSYIIPYESIIRSYSDKKHLYIEINKNHKDFKCTREYSTKQNRIVFNFADYPELKKYIKNKTIAQKLKIKSVENIEMSDYI